MEVPLNSLNMEHYVLVEVAEVETDVEGVEGVVDVVDVVDVEDAVDGGLDVGDLVYYTWAVC